MKRLNKIQTTAFIFAAVLLLSVTSFAQQPKPDSASPNWSFYPGYYICVEQTEDAAGKLKSKQKGDLTLNKNNTYAASYKGTYTVAKDVVIAFSGTETKDIFKEATAYPSNLRKNRYYLKINKTEAQINPFVCELNKSSDEFKMGNESSLFYNLMVLFKPLSETEEKEIRDDFFSTMKAIQAKIKP